MNYLKIMAFGLILIAIQACGSGNKAASELFEIAIEGNKTSFKKDDRMGISIINKENKPIDALKYTLNGEAWR